MIKLLFKVELIQYRVTILSRIYFRKTKTIHTTCHGPRPRPVHENTWAVSWAGQSGSYKAHIPWAAARLGPPYFESMGYGPARPISFLLHGATHSTIEVALFGVFILWMTGLLNPKSSECHTTLAIRFFCIDGPRVCSIDCAFSLLKISFR